MFYDLYVELCKEKRVSPNKAAAEMGLSNSTVTKWKKTGATPSGETLSKVGNYFSVSLDYLLNHSTKKTPIQSDERQINEDDIKFALFGGAASDAQFEEVKRFARFVRERDRDDGADG